ncbi:tRNA (adenine(22)-N(1))-methyltransferase [Paucilactobacillus nenjiangensis]|uniref:tRNA (adenine(22)-N(1))-methyltransferase n=1 Tax=Paucilactobacillus nenjiangensis TaxID=1296540 RepID=UPI003BAFEA1C
MDSLHLSKRLATVAKYVPDQARMADIGSDHAYLPANLALNSRIEFAIAGEVAKGPYQNALAEITNHHLTNVIEARLADGLAAIETSDRIDTVTIAGMGGTLISDILENGKDKLAQVNRLILEPNVGAEIVRQWLVDNYFEITTEEILSEDQHVYEIIVAEPTDIKAVYDAQEILFGPFLLHEKSVPFVEKWQGQVAHLETAIQQMEQAQKVPADKIKEFQQEIQLIKEVL